MRRAALRDGVGLAALSGTKTAGTITKQLWQRGSTLRNATLMLRAASFGCRKKSGTGYNELTPTGSVWAAGYWCLWRCLRSGANGIRRYHHRTAIGGMAGGSATWGGPGLWLHRDPGFQLESPISTTSPIRPIGHFLARTQVSAGWDFSSAWSTVCSTYGFPPLAWQGLTATNQCYHY